MSDQPVQESLQKMETSFFQTPEFQAITIGVPFCIFKLLFGVLSIRTGLVLFGWLVILWASVDLVMNLVRIAFDAAGRESPIEFCTLAQLGSLFPKTKIVPGH